VSATPSAGQSANHPIEREAGERQSVNTTPPLYRSKPVYPAFPSLRGPGGKTAQLPSLRPLSLVTKRGVIFFAGMP